MGVDLKQMSRQSLEEVFGKGNYDHFDGYFDASCRIHDYGTGGDFSPAEEKQIARMYRSAFPDLKPTVVNQWLDDDGDTVITNWTMTGTHRGTLQGIAPTGRRCTVAGCTISHFRGSKVTEEWVHWDALGLMRQLGVAPAVGQGTSREAPEARPH